MRRGFPSLDSNSTPSYTTGGATATVAGDFALLLFAWLPNFPIGK